MAHTKITIDVEARFVDDVTADSKKAQAELDKLDKKKVKPKVDADSNSFLKKIRAAEDRAKKFGNTKSAAVLSVVDKASTVIAKVAGKAKSFAGKVFAGVVKVKDLATDVLSKVSSLGKSIAGKTWTAIIKIKDLATAPLSKLKNSLFSIKSLVAGIIAGAVTKAAVVTPMGYADSIESSRIAFESKLGSAKAAESFLQEIYKFDEKSPFDTMEIVGITQQMMNLGWTSKDVLNDLGTIGDWSASLGKGEEGISAVTRALGQMRMKGKLSSEEMLQLTEAGVSAWQYLADYMGKDISTIREMAEDGAIDVDTAIKGILTGMGEYTGAAASLADRTVSGLIDQIKSLFKTYVVLPWGEGLAKGFKDAFVMVRDLIDKNKSTLKAFGDVAKEVGTTISEWFADKVEKALVTFQEIMDSEEFKKGSLAKKFGMMWEGVIANPFSSWWRETVIPWWDSTAIPWMAKKAAGLGKAIGSGLTNGLLALLGFDPSSAVEDGITIGGSFMDGFLEGFDTSKITEALQQWASENKVLATGLGIFVGGKILSGLGSALGNIKTLFGGGSGGSGGLGTASVATMMVNAAVVNLNSGTKSVGGGSGTPTVGFFGKLFGSTGNAMVNGSGLLGKLASAGYGLTGGAAGSTLSGGAAAAIGGSSILGIILGALGVGDGVVDFVKASGMEEGSKEKRDKLFQGGTKIGIVGGGAGAGALAGAAIGAAGGPIGAGVGALIGLGVGGLGALFGGDGAGKWLSDATDEGGALNNAWKATKEFFTDTVPEFFSNLWDGVTEFFTETIPDAAGRIGEAISTFFTETIPKKWSEFWTGVVNFFTQTIPYALGYVTGKAYAFFTETVPQFFSDLWNGIATFFTDTLPEWAENVWNNNIVPFFTETIPQFFSNLWEGLTTFFTETLPEWAENVWNNNIVPFFTETIPNFFSLLWSSITTFFTETIPEWADSMWNNHIVPFFTETIPGFFSGLWAGVTTLWNQSIDFISESIWAPIKTFFTETVPGWLNSLWDNVAGWWESIKGSFKAGFGAGSGDGKGGKARGGIVGWTSSMDAFARGGRSDGGIVGGSTRFIRVNEESPEMIIPLSSQRRDRAMKLWKKTGELIGADKFFRGGHTGEPDDAPPAPWKGSYEPVGGYGVQIDMGGVQVEINVDATGSGNVVEAIKAQANEIAETIAGIMADALTGQFENTPTRGALV